MLFTDLSQQFSVILAIDPAVDIEKSDYEHYLKDIKANREALVIKEGMEPVEFVCGPPTFAGSRHFGMVGYENAEEANEMKMTYDVSAGIVQVHLVDIQGPGVPQSIKDELAKGRSHGKVTDRCLDILGGPTVIALGLAIHHINKNKKK